MTTSVVSGLRTVRQKTEVYGRLIRFSHTVFALPFAFTGVLFAWHVHRPVLGWDTVLWVVVAMVGARTAAMAFNRLVDRRYDADNPRTRERELPTGVVSVGSVVLLTMASSALFLFAAAMLNPLCLKLAPLSLAIVLGYSLTKRFTWGSHFFLGAALAIAPLGGWVATAGRLDAEPFLLAVAVLTWIAGMDIFYSLQDEEYDRKAGLHSVPARFGRDGALRISLSSHIITVAVIAALYWRMDLSPAYLAGVGLCAGILFMEHFLVRAGGQRRLSIAFFDMNSLFSLAFLATACAGVWL